jgi:hypothetical protein
MIQTCTYGDERSLAFCAFCGGDTGTRDHCPSRVLLDEPYPENLPVVPACTACNARFSSDEQYLACLISCVLAGSTDLARITRPKIRRILSDSPALRARIEQSRVELANGVIFTPERQRVSTVITKLAQGHVLYELHEPHPEPPDTIYFAPLGLMSEAERDTFESAHAGGISAWPEVGSRAMQHMVGVDTPPEYPWLVVQSGLYRFHASVDSGTSIRIVIHEYLACHVHWD